MAENIHHAAAAAREPSETGPEACIYCGMSPSEAHERSMGVYCAGSNTGMHEMRPAGELSVALTDADLDAIIDAIDRPASRRPEIAAEPEPEWARVRDKIVTAVKARARANLAPGYYWVWYNGEWTPGARPRDCEHWMIYADTGPILTGRALPVGPRWEVPARPTQPPTAQWKPQV